MTSRGVFLVLEGVDGCGKSTQALRLRRRIEALGRTVLHVREPGTTRAGERIRDLLLDSSLGEIEPITEVLLYQAARAQMVGEVVRPALAEGSVVVCERYHYATSAYQGVAGGAGRECVDITSALSTGGLEPDRALLLDVPSDLAGERLGSLLDRVESRGSVYRATVVQALRDVFAEDPERLRTIRADSTPDVVETRVWDAVRDLF